MLTSLATSSCRTDEQCARGSYYSSSVILQEVVGRGPWRYTCLLPVAAVGLLLRSRAMRGGSAFADKDQKSKWEVNVKPYLNSTVQYCLVWTVTEIPCSVSGSCVPLKWPRITMGVLD
jgi:hypothetical protein